MKQPFPLHSRVALRDGTESVYAVALPGTEGWIRDTKEDRDGFHMVQIEWDKEHWRYNGQPDGWTFAEHFKLIGPPEPPQEPVDMVDDELPEPRPTDEQLEDYIDEITEAMDAASESEGFIMVTIRRTPNPEDPSETLYIPQVFTRALSKEAGVLMDAQLLEYATAMYQQLAITLLDSFKRA